MVTDGDRILLLQRQVDNLARAVFMLLEITDFETAGGRMVGERTQVRKILDGIVEDRILPPEKA